MRIHWFFPTLVFLAAWSIAATLIAGTSNSLPGVALGSGFFLHALRAAAFFAIAVMAMAVLMRSTHGDLPVEFGTGGLRYEAGEAARKIEQRAENLQGDIDDLADDYAAMVEAIRVVEVEVERLKGRVS